MTILQLVRVFGHYGVHILEANGQSYRLRQARELRKQTPNRGKEKTRKSAVEAPPKVG